jgi:DTW domain-containing protein
VSIQSSQSRQLCQTCKRPLSVCYCSALQQVTNQIKVLIVQHPLEEKHPFNTGRIAHLGLSNSELIVAESLSHAQLDKILAIPSMLLYPSLAWLPEPVKTGQSICDIASMNQLIVIDATWRKSKKILHLHPRLQEIPRLSLQGELKSNYQIRKTSMADGLSTLESIVKAMTLLEPAQNFAPLLKPFEKMIAIQQSHYTS